MNQELPRKVDIWNELSALRNEVELVGGTYRTLEDLMTHFQPEVFFCAHFGFPMRRVLQIRWYEGKWSVWPIALNYEPRVRLDTLEEGVAEFWKMWRELHGQQER